MTLCSRPWSAPQSLRALVDVPAGLKEGLEPFVPSFDYLVDDLSATPDEALRGRAVMTALAKLVLACFKHLRTDEDPIEMLGEWVDVLDEVARAPTGLEALELVLQRKPSSTCCRSAVPRPQPEQSEQLGELHEPFGLAPCSTRPGQLRGRVRRGTPLDGFRVNVTSIGG